MHIQTDRAFVPAGSIATRYLSVTLSAPPRSAPAPDAPARAGVDVSLVLDRSGSMAGPKINLARRAVAHAIRLLHSADQLNVVVFDDRIDTILERMLATTTAKNQALAALAAVDARGSTDLSEGWFTGAGALSGENPDGRVRRVLLLTDGHANQGIVEPDELAAAAARFRAAGIGTSTFGLGDDFDEELLTRIATEGGGHSYFIEQPVQIPDFLASELGEVLDVVARNVTFEIVAGPGLRVTVLNPLPIEQDGGITRVRLGDFVAEQEVTLLVAVEVQARATGEVASLQCRISDRDGVLPALPMQIDWVAVAEERDRAQPVNRVVIIAVARMMAESARVLALSANRKGGFDDAGHALLAAAEQIRNLGSDEEIRSVADLLMNEEGAFSRGMAAKEMKLRHYAAYSAAHSRESSGSARRKRGN